MQIKKITKVKEVTPRRKHPPSALLPPPAGAPGRPAEKVSFQSAGASKYVERPMSHAPLTYSGSSTDRPGYVHVSHVHVSPMHVSLLHVPIVNVSPIHVSPIHVSLVRVFARLNDEAIQPRFNDTRGTWRSETGCERGMKQQTSE